ncbi:predicted protein [Sclerotinia sclerotiorum 1980 UF-70]|uniref:Uncharacterized protein n=1 Tax=Sclerotinia sclerotiorum (strain ATCC 18683 / 1980 / Ss-1) TaxID=665079 RepID=A7ES54_SCLS1|nr:predicted protein [Sclerotinia sclerotiorum 1980 UF-70]EDN92296.1 predicted protein [Sclerotinia sclerotiorum 1980 UF-70]
MREDKDFNEANAVLVTVQLDEEYDEEREDEFFLVVVIESVVFVADVVFVPLLVGSPYPAVVHRYLEEMNNHQ